MAGILLDSRTSQSDLAYKHDAQLAKDNHGKSRLARAAITRCSELGFLVFSFLLVVVFVNPVREMMFGDDFAYGLTARHLLETGKYQLHDWATANMPVQIYGAAFLAHVFGYSFTVLRCSTLIVFLIGLIAFYYLLSKLIQ